VTMTAISRRSLLVAAAGLMAGREVAGQSAGSRAVRSEAFDVDRFVDDVRQARRESEAQRAVEEILGSAVAQPRRLLAALGEPARAGIHTLYADADVTILNVIWAPLMLLKPHNHNLWASIGIYSGREDNILWKRNGNSIVARGAAALSEREVFGLAADAIHSVTNPIGRLTGAIHIYGGDFFAPGRSEWDAETLREQPWDLEAARANFAKAAARFNAVP
jgi:predicted metal-dependent enzyme (double-stranded beta helix superfamily)